MGIRGKLIKERGHPVKGKKYPNMSLAHLGKPAHNKNIPMKECSKEKLRNSVIEYYKNPDNKKRLSESIKKKWQDPEYRKKCEEAQKGEKSHMWKGEISHLPYSIDWTETLRKAIKERDHYICQLCLKEGIIIHHIDYDKKNCDPINLILLCRSCHSKTNHHREYWKNYFINSRRD